MCMDECEINFLKIVLFTLYFKVVFTPLDFIFCVGSTQDIFGRKLFYFNENLD